MRIGDASGDAGSSMGHFTGQEKPAKRASKGKLGLHGPNVHGSLVSKEGLCNSRSILATLQVCACGYGSRWV